MSTATTVDCPLCGLTVLGQGQDPAAAVAAAADALDQHINDHHQGDQ
jgi:predicted RNase H-like HicB family nuclease